MTPVRAPFPWFGGKRRVAPIVWERLGDVPNYVEPFAGSLAVLLGRPHEPRIETINDRDAYLTNFWRAVHHAPDVVARWADWPVSEADLHARHRWLVDQVEFRERMLTHPDYFDAKIAGWWVWGICQWIGSGWCSQPGWIGRAGGYRAARGINTAEGRPRPALGSGNGIWRRHIHRSLPDIGGSRGAAGRGLHSLATRRKLPRVGERPHGLTAGRLTRKLPQIGGNTGSIGVRSTMQPILDWFIALQARLRRVRICCGDWSRILGPSPTTHIGLTGVFLDPPYGEAATRDSNIYAHDDLELAAHVRAWALKNGDNHRMRIALCGYQGEHDDLQAAGWSVTAWRSGGGYSVRAGSQGKLNRERERIWFSPHCLSSAESSPLFARAAARRLEETGRKKPRL